MTSPSPLERLAGPGNVLTKEPPDTKEFAGLVRSALARLKDAENGRVGVAASGSSDPLAGLPWNRPETVQGFTQSPPNAALLAFAETELRDHGDRGHLPDIECGAGRNASPMAGLG